MIFEALITAVSGLILGIFSILPDLPDMPTEIVSASSWLVTTISGVTNLLSFLYGHALYVAIVGATISLFLFEHVYHLALWILRKLPISSN